MTLKEKPVYEIDAIALHAVRLSELWHYRHLSVLLAMRQIKVRYKQTVLGLIWAIVVPIAFTTIFLFLFRSIGVEPSGVVPYVPATFAGLVLWQFFSRGVLDGSMSLSSNSNLITKVYFPRIVLPLSCVLSALFDVLISFLILVAVLIYYRTGLTWRIFFAPVFIAQVLLLVFGASLWFSAIDSIFRDLRHAMPLIMQFGMFATPIAYTTSAVVPEKWLWLYEFNPLAAPVEGFRWALIENAPAVGLLLLAKSIAITLVLLATGLAVFARVERTVADHV